GKGGQDVAGDTYGRRDGISGQAQDGRAGAGNAEPERLSRTLGDLVEDAAHTELLESPRHEVQLAHRDAAAQHEHVVGLQVEFEPMPELARIVGNVVVRHTLEAM